MNENVATVEMVPVSRIVAGNNDRKVFDPDGLKELAKSIKENGLAQPITVRPVNGHFEVIAGERRFRAVSQVLGWPEIPAIVREMDDESASAIMLTENMARADLNPIEEGNAYQSRMERFGWSIEKVAEVAGVSERLVKARLSLLRLVPEAQKLLADGQLGIGHAEALVNLDNNRQRIALRILGEGKAVSLAQFRVIVNDLLEEQSQDSLFNLENFWVEQVKDMPAVHSGKRATTGVITREDVPKPKIMNSAGATIEAYIASLLENQMEGEAAAIGVLYDEMVKACQVKIPHIRHI